MYPVKMSLLLVHCIIRIPVYSKKRLNKKDAKVDLYSPKRNNSPALYSCM